VLFKTSLLIFDQHKAPFTCKCTFIFKRTLDPYWCVLFHKTHFFSYI